MREFGCGSSVLLHQKVETLFLRPVDYSAKTSTENVLYNSLVGVWTTARRVFPVQTEFITMVKWITYVPSFGGKRADHRQTLQRQMKTRVRDREWYMEELFRTCLGQHNILRDSILGRQLFSMISSRALKHSVHYWRSIMPFFQVQMAEGPWVDNFDEDNRVGCSFRVMRHNGQFW